MSTKRKSDASTSAASKKARLAHAATAEVVQTILDEGTKYLLPENDDDIVKSFIALAEYARSLEEQVAATKPKVKAPEDLEAAAQKLRKAAVSGIKKQMTWKTTCKTNSAKWTYDGVCSDPEVFGAMLKLGGPPTFKMKKIPPGEFQDLVGHIEGSVRYNNLYIGKGDVNVHWKPDEGTFKFSGTYGIDRY